VVPLANLVSFTSECMKAHIFELIVAVIYTFNPVLKFKPEKKIKLERDSNPGDFCDSGALQS